MLHQSALASRCLSNDQHARRVAPLALPWAELHLALPQREVVHGFGRHAVIERTNDDRCILLFGDRMAPRGQQRRGLRQREQLVYLVSEGLRVGLFLTLRLRWIFFPIEPSRQIG